MSTELDAEEIADEVQERLESVPLKWGKLSVRPTDGVAIEGGEARPHQSLAIILWECAPDKGVRKILASTSDDSHDHDHTDTGVVDVDETIGKFIHAVHEVADPEVCECCGRPHDD